MRRNPVVAIFLLIALALATAWGFATVLGQRFRSGEVYPQFSTFRSDPLGAKALYQALDGTGGVTCERNLRRLDKLEGAKNHTLFFLHVQAGDYFDRSFTADFIQKYAAAGGRVVLTLDGQGQRILDTMERSRAQAERERHEREAEERRKKKLKKDGAKDGISKAEPSQPKEASAKSKPKTTEADDWDDPEDDDEKPSSSTRSQSIARGLGVRVKMMPYTLLAKGGDDLQWRGSLPLDKDELPQWHSNSYFEFVAADDQVKRFVPVAGTNKWTVHAGKQDRPMVIERTIGQGSVVMLSDSYFASNEALFKEPRPAFLSWLVGHAETVIFDETHLGTGENPGIMTLARRYRLHGMFIGALILFALFIWRNTMSLVPPSHEEEASDAVAGHGATAGLISLIKRGVPSGAILKRCLEVWKKSNPPRTAVAQARMQDAEYLLSLEANKSRWQRNSAAAYARICAVINPPRR
jgi:hypothetical protein